MRAMLASKHVCPSQFQQENMANRSCEPRPPILSTTPIPPTQSSKAYLLNHPTPGRITLLGNLQPRAPVPGSSGQLESTSIATVTENYKPGAEQPLKKVYLRAAKSTSADPARSFPVLLLFSSWQGEQRSPAQLLWACWPERLQH